MKTTPGAIMAGLLLSQLSLLHAQTTLVDWDHTWNYMHPFEGALPTGSGATTPHPDGTTPWFDTEVEFGASYAGPSFTTAGADFDAGSGSAPFGYGDVDYITTPLPAPAEFSAVNTALTTPASGSRRTAYFRTTFTVPDDGNFYTTPTLRYILDDGGFVYLDGELVLKVNVSSAAADDYLLSAGGTANTESHIRDAILNLPVDATTGGNTDVDPAIAGNATVVKRITQLAPGVHTLAVSVHNAGTTSSDLTLAVQLTSVPSDCLITATPSGVVRDSKGTADPADDTVDFNLVVVPTGTVSSTWKITDPAGSAIFDQTGAYNTSVAITGVPITEFAGGPVDFTVADSENAACTAPFSIAVQGVMASNNLAGTNLPVFTSQAVPSQSWVVDDAARTLTMNNPGGATPVVVQSLSVDLTGQPDVQFSGELEIIDTSSGNEPEDSFVAYLIFDGNTGSPVNLITPHDTIDVDGVLTGDELAPNAGTFVRDLSFVIPGSVDSVEIVIEGNNNSGSETFVVKNLSIDQASAELRAEIAGTVVLDNKGTDTATDDTLSAPVTVTPVNLSPSTGWNSNATPASGLYADSQPVNFGSILASASPFNLTLTDVIDSGKTASVTVTAPVPALTVSAPTNLTRIENGIGSADDTFTFEVDIAGTDGGPGWVNTTAGVTPASGAFGTVVFTVAAPLTPGNLDVIIEDVSYPLATQTVSVNVFDRYVIGQSDLSGSLEDIGTDLSVSPAPQWINDAGARTLTMNAGGTSDKVVESEVLDLTSADEVFFSATFRANEVSTGSNFETTDRFKAELVFNIAGTPTTINLISPFDNGNGAPATTGTTGGVNGAPDGYLSGYQGSVGTDLEDATVYASTAEDYNAHIDRDEFNRNGEIASIQIDNTFNLNAVIPANADDVQLVITGAGVGGSETFTVSNILFSTTSTTDDTDSDGMTDDYEDANGLNKNDPGDKNLDLDGDGQSNFQEFLAGTAANDPNSVFRITSVSRTATTATVNWSSVPGKTYRIDLSTDLINWTDAGQDFPSGGTSSTTGPIPLADIGNPPSINVRVRVSN